MKKLINSEGKVDEKNREKLIGQKGIVFWFTGNSGAGKSTIAIEIERLLGEKGIITYRIDGDNIRQGLNSDLGFSKRDREENIRRIAEVSKILTEIGIVTLVCTISPLLEMRKISREILPSDKLKEFYIKADIDICKKRDPKGFYKHLYNNSNYIEYQEEQNDNVIIIDTNKLCVDKSIRKVMSEISNYLN